MWSLLKGLFVASVALLLSGSGRLQLHAQEVVSGGTIRGRVTDLQTGEPIARATVAIVGQKSTAATDHDGQFTLAVGRAGAVDLSVSAAGYGLLKRQANVPAGATLAVELRLGQEALRDTQEVTVVARPFDPVVPDAVTQYSLTPSELQNLSTVLANDPFRAVAKLPGVSSNQEFYADFAVRGAGLPHIGVYIDGVLVDRPTYSLEHSGDIGSVSVVNGDIVGSISLMSGSFPISYGDRTGAILAVTTRDGARDRVSTRFTADALGAILTSEGPVGKSKKASWLLSGRQSYLAYLQARLGVAGGLTLNYNDATGKLSYDPNLHHRFSYLESYGSTSASRSPIYLVGETASFFTSGASQHGMSALGWDWMPSAKTVLQSQGSWTHDHEYDTNQAYSAVDLNTTSDVYGAREDLTRQIGGSNRFQAGFDSRWLHQQRNSYTQWNYATDTLSSTLLPFDAYSRSMSQMGGYVQDTSTLLNKRLAVGIGGRGEHFTPSGQTAWLTHASAVFTAEPGTSVSLGFGQYAQAPNLQQLYGGFGTPSLRAERATHETIAVDHLFTETLHLHAELYNRQEHEDIYSPQTEFRLLAIDQVGFPVPGPVLGNNLDAYARGFEISLQRRSVNHLSGWVNYAWSRSRYWQTDTALSFAGDYDQRNTLSAYAAYRITRTVNLSCNTRYGSGFPIPGFLASDSAVSAGTTGIVYRLSQERNAVRAGDYLRSDARVNKVFNARRFNLTVHGEVENLTGHQNYIYYDFLYAGSIARYPLVYATRGTSLPVLPVAGFTLEF